MPMTLLQGVNQVLRKTELIDSDGDLTSLSDTARQSWIDTAVQALNETVDELYDLPTTPDRPQQVASSTVTLATNDQDYSLASDLIRILPKFGLVDRTNNHVILIDSDHDAYRRLIIGDIEQDDTGLPSVACIEPLTGLLWLDKKPTATYNGRVYYYYYEKDLGLSLAADTFPFTDPVFRAVVEAATEKWMRLNNREYSHPAFRSALARAASRLSQVPRRSQWGDDYAAVNATDPLES